MYINYLSLILFFALNFILMVLFFFSSKGYIDLIFFYKIHLMNFRVILEKLLKNRIDGDHAEWSKLNHFMEFQATRPFVWKPIVIFDFKWFT